MADINQSLFSPRRLQGDSPKQRYMRKMVDYTPQRMQPTLPQGLVAPGNIDLYNRPKVKNPDGSVSTVLSMSFSDDNGKEILIPQVVGDRVVSPEEAIKNYYSTGQHLGIFATPEDATAFAQQLHSDYEHGKYDRNTSRTR